QGSIKPWAMRSLVMSAPKCLATSVLLKALCRLRKSRTLRSDCPLGSVNASDFIRYSGPRLSLSKTIALPLSPPALHLFGPETNLSARHPFRSADCLRLHAAIFGMIFHGRCDPQSLAN